MKFRRRKKGFTLVELLVVIAVLGIIAGIGVNSMSGITDIFKLRADDKTVQQIARTIQVRLMADDSSLLPSSENSILEYTTSMVPEINVISQTTGERMSARATGYSVFNGGEYYHTRELELYVTFYSNSEDGNTKYINHAIIAADYVKLNVENSNSSENFDAISSSDSSGNESENASNTSNDVSSENTDSTLNNSQNFDSGNLNLSDWSNDDENYIFTRLDGQNINYGYGTGFTVTDFAQNCVRTDWTYRTEAFDIKYPTWTNSGLKVDKMLSNLVSDQKKSEGTTEYFYKLCEEQGVDALKTYLEEHYDGNNNIVLNASNSSDIISYSSDINDYKSNWDVDKSTNIKMSYDLDAELNGERALKFVYYSEPSNNHLDPQQQNVWNNDPNIYRPDFVYTYYIKQDGKVAREWEFTDDLDTPEEQVEVGEETLGNIVKWWRRN